MAKTQINLNALIRIFLIFFNFKYYNYQIYMKRVVITGLGMVSSIGTTAQISWNSLINGKSGIKSYHNDPILKNSKQYNFAFITDFDSNKYNISYINTRMNKFLHSAFEEALNDSKFNIEQQKHNTGVCIGTLGSNISRATQIMQDAVKTSYDKINRFSLFHLLSNMPVATLTTKYGLTGPSQTVSLACATGLGAIGNAYRWIKLGEADAAFAGGLQDSYNPLSTFGSIKLGAMSQKKYEKPQFSSRPFDKHKSGFIIGQGAGIVLLQQYQKAKKRNAHIYAQIVGFSCFTDGYHLSRPLQTGEGIYRTMKTTLQKAQISINQLDHINCHATSTNVGDQIQAKAIYELLETDQNRKKVMITANKGHIGHGFGASGAIQLIFGILSMKNNISPKILNLEEPIDIKLNYSQQNISRPINNFLKNSFGFGGVNTCMVLKKI